MPLPAEAGAWTRAQGDGLLSLPTTYTTADEGFNQDGNRVDRLKFEMIETAPYYEYGLLDTLTFGLQPKYRDVEVGYRHRLDDPDDQVSAGAFAGWSMSKWTFLVTSDNTVGLESPPQVNTDEVLTAQRSFTRFKAGLVASYRVTDNLGISANASRVYAGEGVGAAGDSPRRKLGRLCPDNEVEPHFSMIEVFSRTISTIPGHKLPSSCLVLAGGQAIRFRSILPIVPHSVSKVQWSSPAAAITGWVHPAVL